MAARCSFLPVLCILATASILITSKSIRISLSLSIENVSWIDGEGPRTSNRSFPEVNDDPELRGDPKTNIPVAYKRVDDTIAVCLLVMDDSIKLTEWLAYHYTILPLGNLIVAIDPRSLHPDRVLKVLGQWKDPKYGLNITVWQHDTWIDLAPDQGWRRKKKQFTPNDPKYDYVFHKRRQHALVTFCMREMKRRGASWTLLTDTDEFLVFNYVHNDTENWDVYDTVFSGHSERDIDREREQAAPIRAQLPPLGLMSLASFLRQHQLPRCLRLPGLSFSSHGTSVHDVAGGVRASHLMTLRHRRHGKRNGKFSKVLVDVSRARDDELIMDKVDSIHNPNRAICGHNGRSTSSGADYIASILRLNHYVGTREAFLEREADARYKIPGRSALLDFEKKNHEIVEGSDDDDVKPWVDHFVQKVGLNDARSLLRRLDEVYDTKESRALRVREE